jgi:hypothetical protein
VRLGLAWQRRIDSRYQLSLEVYHNAWELGRSDDETLRQGGVPVGTVHEPRSETRHSGVRAGLLIPF